jgi:hypothetical protein
MKRRKVRSDSPSRGHNPRRLATVHASAHRDHRDRSIVITKIEGS